MGRGLGGGVKEGSKEEEELGQVLGENEFLVETVRFGDGVPGRVHSLKSYIELRYTLGLIVIR